MRKLLFLSLLFVGCVSVKYTYTFDHKAIDFSKGKWVLNKTFEVDKSSMMDEIAFDHFEKILGDSLFGIDEVVNTGSGIMNPSVPYKPTINELKEIQKGTGCDYLINIKGTIVRDDIGIYGTHNPISFKSRIAKVDIIIYNLNTLELISHTTETGTVERTLRKEDSITISIPSVESIKRQALLKLIKKYKRNKI
ncbi:MAG: hypothetical protein L3J08_02365 [Flavobacteriaceae bacterium]|nr:hypothetical protein [Flavobacteriaceae bacterium]